MIVSCGLRSVPERAGGLLLPDAGLVPRRRGPGAGNNAACVEGAGPVRPQPGIRSHLVVPDRNQRVPVRAGGACAAAVAVRAGCAERGSRSAANACARRPVAAAVPRCAVRPGPAGRHAARASGGTDPRARQAAAGRSGTAPRRSPGTSSGSAACWTTGSCCWAGRPGSCFPGSGPHGTIRSPGRMNAVPKLVASRTMTDASAWANSQVTGGGPVDANQPRAARCDHHRQPERRAPADHRGPDR